MLLCDTKHLVHAACSHSSTHWLASYAGNGILRPQNYLFPHEPATENADGCTGAFDQFMTTQLSERCRTTGRVFGLPSSSTSNGALVSTTIMGLLISSRAQNLA